MAGALVFGACGNCCHLDIEGLRGALAVISTMLKQRTICC
jgi:hypothetical protein